MQKVPAGVNIANNHGVSCPIRKVPIQRDRPAMLIANPRALVGYISDKNTKITALMDPAQKKMYKRKEARRNSLGNPICCPLKK